MKSVLTKNQKQTFSRVYKGKTVYLTIRYDDDCGNGHNSFAMTYHIWNESKTDYSECGSNPELIAEVWPEFAHLLKWRSCSSDGPMRYTANTLYHTGDRDCWGLKDGEKRQIINGRTKKPSWSLVAVDKEGNEIDLHKLNKYKDSDTQPPCEYNLEYRPWCQTGQGKTPDLDAARRTAIWPDATLEQLQSKEALEARLPALLEEFKKDVEAIGFVF